MDLALESDIYCPLIDNNNNYVDKVPPNIPHGIRCPCGTRKDKVYYSQALFHSHIKSKHHIAWLSAMNLNKMNYYKENEDLKKTIANQKSLILQLEKEKLQNLRTINYLSQQLIKLSSPSDEVVETDLLDW